MIQSIYYSQMLNHTEVLYGLKGKYRVESQWKQMSFVGEIINLRWTVRTICGEDFYLIKSTRLSTSGIEAKIHHEPSILHLSNQNSTKMHWKYCT